MPLKSGKSLAEMMDELFDINIQKYSAFRNALNTLLKKKKLFTQGDKIEGRRIKQIILLPEITTFNNVVLLHAIFPNPKIIEKIFFDLPERTQLLSFLKDLFIERQTIVGIGISSPLLNDFFQLLETDADLKEVRLPNPFEVLPQTQLNGATSLSYALITQNSALSASDSMMAHFFNNDLDQAAELANKIQTDSKILNQYKQLILKEHQEAIEFQKIIEEWRN